MVLLGAKITITSFTLILLICLLAIRAGESLRYSCRAHLIALLLQSSGSQLLPRDGAVSALDCYVCLNQEDNKEKCVRTVKTCDLGQDQCLTEVRWAGKPYWAPSGDKQYYVSKRCASKENCTAERERTSRRCERIWYNDWECVDCCHGDRCNFFVTLASSHLSPSVLIFVLIPSVLLLFRR